MVRVHHIHYINVSTILICATVMYVFGGWDHKSHFNDMWRLPLHSLFEAEPHLAWEVVDQRGEVPRKRHTHSTVVHGDDLLLFGGAGGYDLQFGFLHFNEVSPTKVLSYD